MPKDSSESPILQTLPFFHTQRLEGHNGLTPNVLLLSQASCELQTPSSLRYSAHHSFSPFVVSIALSVYLSIEAL